MNHRELFENTILLRSFDRLGAGVVPGRGAERLVSERRRHQVAGRPGVHGEGRVGPAQTVGRDDGHAGFLADSLNGAEQPVPARLRFEQAIRWFLAARDSLQVGL